MGYCIYLKKSEPDVKFTKREHVIPAGIGGISKLPLGVVSDEANEHFSPLEMDALRKSFISINRNNVGPGKRGSFNIKKVKSPTIRILKEAESLVEQYKLGFAFAGEIYIITQIAIDFNDKEEYYTTSYYSTVFDGQYSKQTVIDFRDHLITFLANKKRKFRLINMPYNPTNHFVNIGYYEGKWFAATSHKVINMDYLAWMLLPELKREQIEYIDKEPSVLDKSLLQYSYQLDMSSSLNYFIYAKTAFNVLAFLKGSDFIQHERFEGIRKSIVDNNDIDNFIVNDKGLYGLIEDIVERVPKWAHYAIITTENNSILAFVGFYGEKQSAIIRLAGDYVGESLRGGIICDWMNRSEFNLDKLT
jgi:hypothetical protein